MDAEELGNPVRQVAEYALGGKYVGEREQENRKIYLLAMLVLKLDEIGYELAALNAKAGRLVEVQAERRGE